MQWSRRCASSSIANVESLAILIDPIGSITTMTSRGIFSIPRQILTTLSRRPNQWCGVRGTLIICRADNYERCGGQLGYTEVRSGAGIHSALRKVSLKLTQKESCVGSHGGM